jgi:hypothetical protein
MNIQKMSDLIMKHPEFLDCCEKRFETSSVNKPLHQSMMDFINAGDLEGVEKMLCDPFYTRPLRGVIFCMDATFDVIDEFNLTFNAPPCTQEEYLSLQEEVKRLTKDGNEVFAMHCRAESKIKMLEDLLDCSFGVHLRKEKGL